MNLSPDWINFLNLNAQAFSQTLTSFLQQFPTVIPQKELIFAAFNHVPPTQVKAILLGEDPYPRPNSACGIAFLDNEIRTWDSISRGNSLKHIHKALLISRGLATAHTSLADCRIITKKAQIQEPAELLTQWMNEGILLLNTSLTFSTAKDKSLHFAFWSDFISLVLATLENHNKPYYILWGKKAQLWANKINIEDKDRIISHGHPTYQHHFFNKALPDWSPLSDIEKRSGLNLTKKDF